MIANYKKSKYSDSNPSKSTIQNGSKQQPKQNPNNVTNSSKSSSHTKSTSSIHSNNTSHNNNKNINKNKNNKVKQFAQQNQDTNKTATKATSSASKTAKPQKGTRSIEKEKQIGLMDGFITLASLFEKSPLPLEKASKAAMGHNANDSKEVIDLSASSPVRTTKSKSASKSAIAGKATRQNEMEVFYLEKKLQEKRQEMLQKEKQEKQRQMLLDFQLQVQKYTKEQQQEKKSGGGDSGKGSNHAIDAIGAIGAVIGGGQL